MKYTLLIPILFLSFYTISVAQNPFEDSEAIGKYTAGCVLNPRQLSIDGYGYQVIRTSRNRYYGHKELIRFTERLSTKVKSNYSAKLLIADITKRNGGPMLDDHSSHQTGLDIDILYIRKGNGNNEYLTISERENMSPKSLLNNSKTGVNPSKWSWINGEVLKIAANDNTVDRIFVNPAIKKDLCEKYRGQDWLRKLRPWWGHDGHFHVRIKCPEVDTKCISSPTLPDGNGCGSDLNWWFSKKAQDEHAKKKLTSPKKKEEVRLPKECLEIL